MSTSLLSRSRDFNWNNLSIPSEAPAGADLSLPLNILSLDDNPVDGQKPETVEGNSWEGRGRTATLAKAGESKRFGHDGQINNPGAMVGSSEQEEMLGILKIQILEEHRELLCKRLTPDRLMPYLRSVFLLTRDDCEEIWARVTSSQKVDHFLDILITKGASSFDHLCEAILRTNDRGWITTVLKPLNIAIEQRRIEVFGRPSYPEDEATPEEDLPVPGRPGGPEVPK